jgi:hypothetical protein
MQQLDVDTGQQQRLLPFNHVLDMPLVRDAPKLMTLV